MFYKNVFVPVPKEYLSYRDSLRCLGYELAAYSDNYDDYLGFFSNMHGEMRGDTVSYLKKHKLFGIYKMLFIDEKKMILVIDRPEFPDIYRRSLFPEHEMKYKIENFIEEIRPAKISDIKDMLPNDLLSCVFLTLGAPVIVPGMFYVGAKAVVNCINKSATEKNVSRIMSRLKDVPEFKEYWEAHGVTR